MKLSIMNFLFVWGLSPNLRLKWFKNHKLVGTFKLRASPWDLLFKLFPSWFVIISDIGGGYKRRDDEKMSTKEIGHLIQQSVNEHFHSLGESPTVIAEPGR